MTTPRIRTVQPDTCPGKIVVAIIEDEVTVKRFQMDGEEERVKMLGKVIGVFRRLQSSNVPSRPGVSFPSSPALLSPPKSATTKCLTAPQGVG